MALEYKGYIYQKLTSTGLIDGIDQESADGFDRPLSVFIDIVLSSVSYTVAPESDPVFTAWLAGPPNISLFTNDVGYVTSVPAETDPDFNAWLSGPPNTSEFTNDSGFLYYRYAGMTGVPTWTEPGVPDGSVTIGETTARLYGNALASGVLSQFTIPAKSITPPNNAQSYIVIDYNAGTPEYECITDVDLIDEIQVLPVYTVYREGTLLHKIDWDYIALALPEKIHKRLVKTDRFVRESGLELSEGIGNVIEIAEGRIWYGAQFIDLNAVDSFTGQCWLHYHTAPNVWTGTLVGAYDKLHYDDNTGGLKNLSALSYAVNYVFRDIDDASHMHIVLGQEDANLRQANVSALPYRLPDIITKHCILVGKIIVLRNAASATSIISAFNQVLSSGGAALHNDLSNIQGGATNEYYHLTATESAQIPDWNTAYGWGDHSVVGYLIASSTSNVTFRSLRLGYSGMSGQLELYSEQGGTDYVATLKPNALMTADSDFFLPSSNPIATYLMTMDSSGVMGFDTNQYVALTGNQSIDGVKTFTSFPITPSATPTTDYQVANKAYVDSLAAGLGPKESARVATTTVLPACTYAGTPNFTLTANANGVLADIDGVTLVNGDRFLVKDQGDQTQNGIYVVTDVGADDPGGSPFILTRTSDYNTDAEVAAGTFMYIEEGATNIAHQFVQITASPTLDTNPLVFTHLYAPIAETLASVTGRGATTTEEISVGGLKNNGSLYEAGVVELVNTDSPYTVLSTDNYLYCDATSGDITINLPAATATGRILTINRIDNSDYTVSVVPDATGVPDTINRESTQELEQDDSLTIHDKKANEWAII